MIVTPYYSKPSQLGILKHFEAINNKSNLPIMVYNIPGRTSTLIELETIETLVNEINIHSIKDAVGDIKFSIEQIERIGDKAKIYSGDDALTYEFVKNGAEGVVSVASHVVGKEISEMINLLNHNKHDQAKRLIIKYNQSLVYYLKSLVLVQLKYLLSITWEDVGHPLLPITEISSELSLELLNNFKKIQ